MREPIIGKISMMVQEIPHNNRRLLIAITGASGVIYGVRMLEILAGRSEIETHLILSKSGRLTLSAECGTSVAKIEDLANVVHSASNIGAALSSGSFRVDGMIIVPCSIKTASNIAYGNTADLISRAGDVMLKERRALILAVRETPLHAGHLETLTRLAQLGAVVFPPVPSFYHRPKNIQDIIDQTCMRILDQIGVCVDVAPRWGEANGITALGNGPNKEEEVKN